MPKVIELMLAPATEDKLSPGDEELAQGSRTVRHADLDLSQASDCLRICNKSRSPVMRDP
jgi:hypothetical protein